MAEARYTNEYSKLPESVLPNRKFRDVDNTVATYVNSIKEAQASGNYSRAADLIAAFKVQGIDLSDYIIDSSFINLLDEEIRNLEIYCKSQKQGIYYSENEPHALVNDVWIG